MKKIERVYGHKTKYGKFYHIFTTDPGVLCCRDLDADDSKRKLWTKIPAEQRCRQCDAEMKKEYGE